MTEENRMDLEREDVERQKERERYQSPKLEPTGCLRPRLQGSPPEPPPWP